MYKTLTRSQLLKLLNDPGLQSVDRLTIEGILRGKRSSSGKQKKQRRSRQRTRRRTR